MPKHTEAAGPKCQLSPPGKDATMEQECKRVLEADNAFKRLKGNETELDREMGNFLFG